MRLRALELQGFKSFPDRTRLEFDDGITAVVGPNGSGKSNIADAIRWVLGEQSTKALRGARMEDVIFNGTQERKPVGYAMVRMFLDNSRERLPEYGQEITVSRRLYRSGESEYSIDGTQVRMRDIHELFMDTGLGRDGYSMIGQGKIAEIVSAKSGDRREVFEEAAGIAKFRYRRTDAERRLTAAEENLFRLSDIIVELEDRVEPLREQSEKAKRFLLLAEERKGLEISLWMLELNELKRTLAEQETKVLIAKNDYKNLESASQKLEEQLTETYQRMQELAVATDERRTLIRSLEERKAQEQSRAAVLENDIHHNKQALVRIAVELKHVQDTAEQTKAALAAAATAFQAAKITLQQKKNGLATTLTAYEQEQQQVATAQQALEALAGQRAGLEQALTVLRLQRVSDETRSAEGEYRLSELAETEIAYEKAVDELEKNTAEANTLLAEQTEKVRILRQKKDETATQKAVEAIKLEQLQATYAGYADDIHQKRSRVRILQELEANMEGFAGSVRFVMQQHEKQKLKGIFGPISSLIRTEKEYTVAIETALGGALQHIVVEAEAAAKAAMNALKQNKAGRATFLPLTSVKGRPWDFSDAKRMAGYLGSGDGLVTVDDRFKGVIIQLLGRVCVVDNLDNATAIAKANGYRFRVVTLDGQVINAGGSFTGGSTARSAGLLSRKGEIDELTEDGKALRAKADALEPTIQGLTEALSRFDHSIIGLEEAIAQEEQEKTRLRFSLEQLTRNLEQNTEQYSLAKQGIEALHTKLQDSKKNQQTAAEQLVESTAAIAKSQEQEASLREALAAHTSESAALQEALAEARLAEYAAQKDIESVDFSLATATERSEQGSREQERLHKEGTELEERNARLKTQIEELTVSIAHRVTEVEENNKSIAELLTRRTQLEQGTTDLRQQERDIANKREGVSRELVRLEERAHAVQGQYDGIITQLWDEYELTRSVALEQATPLKEPDKAKRRLTELRSSIRALGTVNVDAIEEYKEVSERYTFLSEQVADVRNAREQLLALIHELTEEMQTLFLETFHRINDEFSVTFQVLFGGGKAQLLLTQEEDVLEAGIEIHVQPPGKVIKSISLLSGGEQSFVAIAIYFAILKVNPAPFVLLDEIEAALDDVNVTRFATYLRQLSTETQFIAITHRRGTMEEADVLYGVTMQENGISKLLELNINEVESKLGMEETE